MAMHYVSANKWVVIRTFRATSYSTIQRFYFRTMRSAFAFARNQRDGAVSACVTYDVRSST